MVAKYGVKLAGRFMIPKSPFREAYFLDDALEFRKALKLPLIYVGGLVARPTIERCSTTDSNSYKWDVRSSTNPILSTA